METIKHKILIIDDKTENRQILASILKADADYNLILAASGKVVVNRFLEEKNNLPDLILLDVLMPEMNGFEVAEILKSKEETKHIPLIFITGLTDQDNIKKCFDYGGSDYITKPINKPELLTRIKNQLTIIEQNKILENKKQLLKTEVDKKTLEIKKIMYLMIGELENTSLCDDKETLQHLRRVSDYSTLLAGEFGCNTQFVEAIKLYAPLHDIGKIGIPESIRKKEGIYTNVEFEMMKNHVETGFKMLFNKDINAVALNIIRYHHEKWDGTGYLKGLAADEIPLEARIVALCDTYDALKTEHSWKKALPEEECDRIIKEASGKHFDPDLVNLFFRVKEKILDLANNG